MLIRQVAKCYSVASNDDAVKIYMAELLVFSGAAVASETLAFLPVFGWAIKSALLAGKAHLLGRKVIDYFERKSQLPD
jgi:hypothetical protein